MILLIGTVEKVIPAEAGIHFNALDPHFHEDDSRKLALFRQSLINPVPLEQDDGHRAELLRDHSY